jgi:predicted transposase YbfD/YdcC
MDETDHLSQMECKLTKAVQKIFGVSDRSTVVFQEKFSELFNLARENCEQSSLADLKDRAPKLLAIIRTKESGFASRSFERWRPSFDHLETMFEYAQELGESHGKSVSARSDGGNNYVMTALSHIFPRALLVTQEVICLLKGGFPDGALARWRSLHELAVTAMYIKKHGEDTAERYLLSFYFASRRSAHQINEHSLAEESSSISEDELADLDAACSAAEALLGRKILKDKDGEWPAINPRHRTFASIEEDVDMDHWRPKYKWASTHTHANHRPADKPLGMTETRAKVQLVGSSNSGFVSPFEMTAITLAQVTSTYLSHGSNVDRVVHTNVLLSLAGEMVTIAMDNERTTREAYEAKSESGLKN